MDVFWQALMALGTTTLHFLDLFPLPTIFVLLAVEEAGVPFPLQGDTLLIAAGARHPGDVRLGLAVIGVATVAVFLRSSLLYALMRRWGASSAY